MNHTPEIGIITLKVLMDAVEDYARKWIYKNKKTLMSVRMDKGYEVFNFETKENFKFKM